FFFFFSSRRRHTRSKRDWSSDVCSSDLDIYLKFSIIGTSMAPAYIANRCCKLKINVFMIVPQQMSLYFHLEKQLYIKTILSTLRSEERRVGKKCKYRWCA